MLEEQQRRSGRLLLSRRCGWVGEGRHVAQAAKEHCMCLGCGEENIAVVAAGCSKEAYRPGLPVRMVTLVVSLVGRRKG